MATLAQKLQLKPGQVMALINTPAGYSNILVQALPDNPLGTADTARPTQALLLFVNNLDEARRLAPEAIQQIDPDGQFWIAYPKGTSKIKTDANRDTLWEALTFTGWRPVRQVALDETWSAMRYRPADKVGS
jgi:hypothetical protein